MRTQVGTIVLFMYVNRRKKSYESIFDWYTFCVIDRLYKRKESNFIIKFFLFNLTLRFPLEIRKFSFYFVSITILIPCQTKFVATILESYKKSFDFFLKVFTKNKRTRKARR